MTLPPVLDLEAAAALVQCEPETLAERALRGDFPGLKIGRGWIFPSEAFVERLNELAKEEAAARRVQPAPLAIATAVAANDGGPPALPALTPPPGGRRDLRRGARRSAPPSLSTSNP